MRFERNTFIGQLTKIGHRKDLVAAGIGKDTSLPVRETMNATCIANDRSAGPKIEMVCISKMHASAGLPQFAGCKTFYIAKRTYRHEARRFDLAVRRSQHSCPSLGSGIGMGEFEEHGSTMNGYRPVG